MRERSIPDVVDLFDRLIVHLDEPFADVSLFPTFLVSQMARGARDGRAQLETAATSCFGGYDAYRAQALGGTLVWRVAGAPPSAGRPRARALAAIRERRRGSSTRAGALRRRSGGTRPKRLRGVPLDDLSKLD